MRALCHSRGVSDDRNPVQPEDLRIHRVRRGDPPVAARDRRLVRDPRQSGAQAGGSGSGLVRGVPRFREARGGLRDFPHTGRRGGRRSEQALGHRADRDDEQDPRLLLHAVLVRLAGQHSRPRPDLAERQRGGQAARRRPAGCRRDLRLRSVREGARRRRLLHRHDGRAAARRRLPGHRRQALHRQRQSGRAGLGVRPALRQADHRQLEGAGKQTDTAGLRGIPVLPGGQPARELPPARQCRGQPDVCGGLRSGELSRCRGRHPAPRRGGFPRGDEHRECRQVQSRLRCCRRLRARLLRGRDARREPNPVRAQGDRVPAGTVTADRLVRAADSDEALQ
ncbi:hypothetical protein NONI108955_15030 [Nocardia ninae]